MPLVRDLDFSWLEVELAVVKRGRELADASWLRVMRMEMKESSECSWPTIDEVR